MKTDVPRSAPSCGSGCRHCQNGQADPTPAVGLTGWRLTISAVAVFLLPLGLAAGGAILLGPRAGGQLAGALGGLLAGAALAVVLARLIRRSIKEAP